MFGGTTSSEITYGLPQISQRVSKTAILNIFTRWILVPKLSGLDREGTQYHRFQGTITRDLPQNACLTSNWAEGFFFWGQHGTLRVPSLVAIVEMLEAARVDYQYQDSGLLLASINQYQIHAVNHSQPLFIILRPSWWWLSWPVSDSINHFQPLLSPFFTGHDQP